MMDPELAAASVLLERPDITDPGSARILALALRETTSSASEETAGLVTTDDVTIPRGPDDEPMTVRVYTPVLATDAAPAIVFFHGGAFVLGDLESEHPRCLRYCAEARCVVVSVDYRLAPEHPYPSGLDDCYAALVWTAEHAASLGIDPDRIAVGGSSAGGALAAATALMARDQGGPAIALQVLLYPVLDDRMVTRSMLEFDATPIWDNRNNRAMWEQYISGKGPVPSYAAPARETELSDLPSAYILSCEYDPLRDEAIGYALRLLQAGVSVELRQAAGAYHGFDQQVADAAISRRALADQVHHLRRFLRA